MSRTFRRWSSASLAMAMRYRFALRGPHLGQFQHLQVIPTNFVADPVFEPRRDNFMQRLRRYGSLGVSPLFCIGSSEARGTTASPSMRALPSNSRPLLAEQGEASGFRPAVVGLVGFVSTGAEWLTAFPDFIPTAFRFSLLMYRLCRRRNTNIIRLRLGRFGTNVSRTFCPTACATRRVMWR